MKQLTTFTKQTCLDQERVTKNDPKFNLHVTNNHLNYPSMPGSYYVILLYKIRERYISENNYKLKEKYDELIRPQEKIDDLWTNIKSYFYYQSLQMVIDNIIKVILVLHKALNKMPIILMGESGSGKTYILKFVAQSLLLDICKYEEMHMHSGTTIIEFKDFIVKAIKSANSETNRPVWIFFDELNRSQFQIYVSEMMTNRVVNFEGGTRKIFIYH